MPSALYQVEFACDDFQYQTPPAAMAWEDAMRLGADLATAHAHLAPSQRTSIGVPRVSRFDPQERYAESFVVYVEECARNLTDEDEVEEAEWTENAGDRLERAYELAQALDTLSRAQPEVPLDRSTLEFQINDGQGDSDSLAVVLLALPGHQAEVTELLEALTDWVQANDYGWDFQWRHGPVETAVTMAEALAELAGTMANNGYEAWAVALEQVSQALEEGVAFTPEPSTPAPVSLVPSSRRGRKTAL